MASSIYRYVFGSLRDERVIEEIPMYGVYMDLALNTGGQFNGTFQLDMTGKRNEDLTAATVPGRTFVAVERNNIAIWIGYIWSRTYQSQAKVVQLYAQSFENYPQHQLILSSINITGDQRNIFRDLWTGMQSVNGRNININVPAAFPSAFTKTVTVGREDRKYYGEIMSSLADATDGFDWYIGVTKSGGNYVKNLAIGYPTLGAPVSDNSVSFEYPGSIVNYYATESMASAATNTFVLGAGEGAAMIEYEQANDDMLASGWPRWDIDVSRKDVTSQALLNTIGAQEGLKRRPPMLTLKPSLIGYAQPEFGSFGLGDSCRLIIRDPRFPNTLQQSARITKWTLRPGETSNTDEYEVLFEGDEDV